MNKGRRSKSAAPAVKRRPSSSQRSRLSRADLATLQQLDRLLEQQRRQEQLAKMVPPGINTEQLESANGTILFRFSHEELGELGQLRITPVPFMVPPGQCHVSTEISSSDPDEDEHWDE